MIRQKLLVSCVAFSLALGAVPAGAQIFGPSDAEQAAAKAHEDGQDAAIAQTQARIQGLEDKVRALTDSLSQATGTNEELNHQIQLQSDKIDRMQKDFAYRLCTLSAQQLGATDSINCANGGTPTAPAGNLGGGAYAPPGGMQPGAPLPPIDATGNGPNNNNGGFTAPPADTGNVTRGRPSGTLGTLDMGSGASGYGAGGAPAQLQGSLAPGLRPSAQYDAAMNLLSKAQYAEAAAAFRSYADTNPDDTNLAPQAIYWVANISFIRQDYATAARTFAEVIKKYPKSPRAGDAMLKLAQSFMAMGQKSEGCTTLGLIKTKYPDATPQTLATAANLRRTACPR